MARAPKARNQDQDGKEPARAGGNWNSSWDPFAALDPGWTEKAITMTIAPSISGALDAKTVELICIARDACSSQFHGPGVRLHIRRALQVGSSKEEIAAVLQLVSLSGLHSMHLGAPILLEELESRQPPHTDTPPEVPTEEIK